MARTAALPALKAESGLSQYLDEIRRFPMLEPQEEYMLARSWREHGDREAAHKLVTSHLRLVAKIAMGYRGYGLPISEVVSEGNVGLMQAVKRFEPEKGFRLATYAMWWIKAAIQEYILRSWSLVKMGTTANQKKLFFNLRKAKSKISALEEGDLRPDQVQVIAKRLGVTEQDVVDMNRRLGGDASLNAPIRDDGESGEWQDWLVDDAPSQERILAESEESDNRHKALISALDVLNEPHTPDRFRIKSFARQKQQRKIGGLWRVNVLLANIFGAALQLCFQSFDRGFDCCGIAFLLRRSEPVVVFHRKLRVDRQPDRRTVFVPGQFDRKLDALVSVVSHFHILGELLGGKHFIQQNAELPFAPSPSCLYVREHTL